MTLITPQTLIGLAVALGVGLLIGVDRERRKGDLEQRSAAGLRTFAATSFSGAVAQLIPEPSLVPIGAVLVALLAAISHLKSRSPDPGMTTEVALFITYLLGVLAMLSPELAAACGACLALLLVARQRLHHFATQWLSDQELDDGMLLAAIALVLLPLMPAHPVYWLGGMEPRSLTSMVFLILSVQAAGHVGVRWLGTRGGLLATGFLSGFVSSTATVISLGAQARRQPAQSTLLAGGATLSAVATWVLALLLSAALSPAAAIALLPASAAGALFAVGAALLTFRSNEHDASHHVKTAAGSALRPTEALVVAVVMALVALLVAASLRRYGDVGLQATVALAGVVDAHSPVASLASLHAAHTISTAQFVQCALIAIGVNTLARCALAIVTGGTSYGLRACAGLLGSMACALATMYWIFP